MSGMLQRSFSLLVALLLVAGAMPQPTPSAADAASASLILPVGPGAPQPASFQPVTFDDFNRTVASGWGTSSSGVEWTDDSLRQNGRTSEEAGNAMSVDGLNGRMDLGTQEPVFMRAGSGPWQEPEWTMTARFKVSTVPATGDDLEVTYWVFTDTPLPYGDGPYLQLRISSDPARGKVAMNGIAGAPPFPVSVAKTDWQANTLYSVKWGHTWGGQSKAKVWRSADPEPGTWLLIRDGTADPVQSGDFTVLEPMGFPANQPSQIWFDDIRFDPGNLYVEPPPPGTEELENSETAADPVQTFSGAFLDRHVDVAIPGRGPAITFSRAYNSADTRVGPLGPGWTHSYATRLTEPGDGTADVLVVRPDGNTDRFQANPDGTYSAPPAVHSSLLRSTDGTFVLTEKDQTAWHFDPSGRLSSIVDRFGNASALTYAGGQLTSISDPAGRGSLTLGYTNGRLTTVTDWAVPARTVTYQYDGSGRLWKVTDREGKTTTFTYDGTSSRIATITDARGTVSLTLTYDGQGRVATQKDARGLITGDVTTLGYVVNPDGSRVTTVTAPATSYEPTFHPTLEDTYDPNGWLVRRVTRPSSTETLTQTFTYDPAGNPTSVTDPRGNRTDFCYDVDYAGSPIAGAAGNLTRRIDPAPSPGADRPVALLQYDAANNVMETVAPKGVPSGPTVSCPTDLSAIDPMYATDFGYDAAHVYLLSRTSRFTDPDVGPQTATTKFEYGDAANPGLVTRVIPPRGNTGPNPDNTYATTFTYYGPGPQAGLRASAIDPLGNTTTYGYDVVGRLTSSVDPLGNAAGGVPADHATTFGYDNEDRTRFVRLPAPVAGGTQLATETRYDEVGSPVVRVDANGQVTTYAYDQRNSLFQVKESPQIWTDPASPPAQVITTEYTRDAGGNPTRITRAKADVANERVTDYVYDGRGLPRAETQYPAWPSTAGPLVLTFTYDGAGNPTTSVDPLGRTTTLGYDSLNRRSSIDYADPATSDVAYSYDANGNRTQMVDGSGTTTYVLDEADRPTAVTSPGPEVVGYRYDLDGNRTKLIYPDSTAVTYTFNKAGQLASLSDWASRQVAYTYWPDGLVKSATNPDTSVATYAYDNARRATDILHAVGSTTISHHAYTLDPVGNVTGLDEFVSGLTPGSPAWTSAAVLNDVQTDVQYGPDVTIGADGAAHAVWADHRSGSYDIYYARRDPVTGAWGPSERVNDVTTSTQAVPAVAVDGSNNVYVIWEDWRVSSGDEDIYFAKRAASSGTWGPSVRVNDDGAGNRQGDPDIAVTSTGAAVAVWYDPRGGASKKNIYGARLAAGASTWSANVRITSNQTAIKEDPKVVLGSTGIAYAAWTDRRNGNPDVFFASLASGSSAWSANVKVSDDPGTAYQEHPGIGVDGSGNLTVVWRDARTSPANVRASRRPAGSSTWGASVVVGGSTVEDTTFDVRADGLAYVAWQEGALGGPWAISGSQYDPATGSWSSPELLAQDPGTFSLGLAIALDASQKIFLFDAPGTNGTTEIYWRGRPFSGGGTDSFTYGYDRLYRLTSVTGPDGNPTYAYDPLGNRTTITAGGTTNYTYDRADRITTAGGTSITVDASGNTTVIGADTFAYDQANRLTSATVGGTTETYTYDGDGTRVSRQVGSDPAIGYVNDHSGGLAVTLADDTRKYVYGLGLAYAVSGTEIEIYHTDQLGSVRALTDATGTVIAAYRTDAWGIPTASSGSSTQPFAFTGEPRDVTGLTYLRTRYYDPDLGRFLSRDTWPGVPGGPQTQNRYAYVGNNPVTEVDPSGRVLDTFLDAGFIVFDIGSLIFGPEKDRAGNWLALGADVGGLLVPFVTGVGAGVRLAEHADDATGWIRWLDDAAQAACSFTAETLVATPDGPVAISAIEVGDIVLAFDESTGAVVERRVTEVIPHPDVEIARLVLDDGSVITTPDHPFYTIETGWVEAGQLWPGAHVKTATGAAIVRSVTVEPYAGLLWDLTVEDAHTFFVGEGAWLVHNCNVTSLIGQDSRLVREAERAAKSVQRSLDDLVAQLAGGNLNPGIGTKHLFGAVFEARARDGARVYFMQTGGAIQIVGKSDKTNQDRVISILWELFGG